MPVAQEDLNSEKKKKIANKVPCSFGDILFNQNHKKIPSVDEISFHQLTGIIISSLLYLKNHSMYLFTQLSRHIFLNTIILSTHSCNSNLIVENLFDIKIVKNI